MDKKTKIIIGGVVVVGVAAYFLLKGKKEPLGRGQLPPASQPTVPTAPTFSNSINIENSSDNNNWVKISSSDRTKATALLQIGTIGSINGTTPCSISEFWLDENGKKASFKCDGQDYYEIPGGSTFKF